MHNKHNHIVMTERDFRDACRLALIDADIDGAPLFGGRVVAIIPSHKTINHIAQDL